MAKRSDNQQLTEEIRLELATYNATKAANLDLIDEKYLDEVLAFISEAEIIMSANPYQELSAEDQEKYYKQIVDIYKNMQTKINEIPIKMDLIGSQCKAVTNAVRTATYSAETLFWGAKVDNVLLSKIDKTKLGTQDIQTFDLGLMEIAMLHGILTSRSYEGLTFDNYLIAKMTVDITEYVKVYNQLNVRLDQLSRAIDDWDGTSEAMMQRQAMMQGAPMKPLNKVETEKA